MFSRSNDEWINQKNYLETNQQAESLFVSAFAAVHSGYLVGLVSVVSSSVRVSAAAAAFVQSKYHKNWQNFPRKLS